jgi:hypothetical protein
LAVPFQVEDEWRGYRLRQFLHSLMPAHKMRKRYPSVVAGAWKIEASQAVLLYRRSLSFNRMPLSILREHYPLARPDNSHPLVIRHVAGKAFVLMPLDPNWRLH